ncbi:HAD hydrolase-like protein [Psychromonas sp. SP041]|uniref:HAD family hydrolase n=1 Tax=Psychromonas sp. SP041 TaxID=1365007 RepID=UPI0003F8836D|nr:HAD hydrolase-like protein [Psychromonas sp. SP041]
MHHLANYDVYIFDCDGVILDSNQLKIDAMRNALLPIVTDANKVNECVDYFRNNFGRSRFHHVEFFVEALLQLNEDAKLSTREAILKAYSGQCKTLYLSANLTPGFIDFVSGLDGKKYIASGSEQGELRQVFKERGLDTYFKGIYGSPAKKSDLVRDVLATNTTNNAVMFGDAVSDFEAAQLNNIDFVAYVPFSNVKDKMTALCKEANTVVIQSWEELNGK